MSSNFDWQAEDEKQWGEFAPEKGRPPGGRLPKRRLLIIGAALLIAVVTAVVVFNRFDQFLDDNAGNVEQDVLRGHNLIIGAAEDGDAELFGDLIFDRLQEWTDAQVLLVERGLLLDREPLNLHLPAGSSPVSTEVKLQPNLREAEVNADYEYRIGSGESGADTVILRQVFSYHLRDDQWLLNPPTGAFWGPWLSTSGRYLTLHYPQRDEQIGQRLAADLEALIGQTCHSVAELNCPADFHFQVELLADPAVLADISDPGWHLSGGRRVVLPTPTVTGLPVDESGYRVLYRAYAQRIAARLVTEQTGLAQNQQAVIGTAILDLVLARLGLLTWPFAPDATPADSDLLLNRARTLWNSDETLQELPDDNDMQPAYALVDFVANEWSAVPAADMLRLLAQASDLQAWLVMLRPAATEHSLSEAYQRYATETRPAVALDAWPDEVVLMMCDQGVVGSANLYQYDPVLELLSIEASGREFIHMEPLPNGDGVVLTELLIRQDGQRTYLWQAGRMAPYEPGTDELGVSESGDSKRSASGRPARQNQISAWSSDGRWLAELGDGFLILSAPAEGFRRLVEYDARDCRAVAWVLAKMESADQ